MSYYKNTTQTPNVIFDVIMKDLTRAELTVLLTIIRRTVGMVDPGNKYKRIERAWISQKLFMLCTGLSGRAISHAIHSLVQKNIIVVCNKHGHILKTKTSRRGVFKLYYSSSLLLEPTKNKKASDLSCTNPVTKSHTIKLKALKLSSYKKSQGISKMSDRERIQQIISQQTP